MDTGIKVTKVRRMTKAEMNVEDWDGSAPIVIEFSDGSKIYPSRDGEGNGPGSMFEVDKDGKTFVLA